jgi:hypothetical protein
MTFIVTESDVLTILGVGAMCGAYTVWAVTYALRGRGGSRGGGGGGPDDPGDTYPPDDLVPRSLHPYQERESRQYSSRRVRHG